MKTLAASGALLLMLVGCEDGFGRAIVGSSRNGPVLGVPCMELAQACAGAPAFVPLVSPPAPGFTQGGCGNAGLACDLLGQPPAALAGCDLTATLLDPDPTHNPYQSLQCARATFTLDASLASIRLDDMKLVRTDLVLIATTPAVVELSHAQLSSTRIELRGPVTLRLSGESALDSVQLVDSTMNGASIELVESDMSDSSVVNLRGLFTAQRSGLSGTSVFASTVQLETCVLTDVQIAAEQLFGAELKNKRVKLEFQTATLSAADSDQLTVQRCGSLLITNSIITGSSFGACSQGLRMDRGSLGGSRVWGQLESHVIIMTGNTFGAGVASSWESWNDSLSNNRFCESLSRTTLFATGTMRCNVCDAVPAPAEQKFCNVPDGTVELPSDFVVVPPAQLIGSDGGFGYNANPSCTVLDMLLACSPPPTNENPF